MLPMPPKWIDENGKRYGRFTVVGFTGALAKNKQRMITCLCDCGLYVDVMLSDLHKGVTQSCGCYHAEMAAARNAEHAKHNATVGGMITALYRVWSQIKQRCYNVKHTAFPDYGGRGIKMCSAWRKAFVVFEHYVLNMIGERPGRRYSLDRIDNNKGYVPGNLRWATSDEQSRNRRNTKFYEFDGERRPLSEWARLAGIGLGTLKSRIYTYGWPLDEALGTPSGYGRCPLEERRKWKGQPTLP